jgi:hypothetical protein
MLLDFDDQMGNCISNVARRPSQFLLSLPGYTDIYHRTNTLFFNLVQRFSLVSFHSFQPLLCPFFQLTLEQRREQLDHEQQRDAEDKEREKDEDDPGGCVVQVE